MRPFLSTHRTNVFLYQETSPTASQWNEGERRSENWDKRHRKMEGNARQFLGISVSWVCCWLWRWSDFLIVGLRCGQGCSEAPGAVHVWWRVSFEFEGVCLFWEQRVLWIHWVVSRSLWIWIIEPNSTAIMSSQCSGRAMIRQDSALDTYNLEYRKHLATRFHASSFYLYFIFLWIQTCGVIIVDLSYLKSCKDLGRNATSNPTVNRVFL